MEGMILANPHGRQRARVRRVPEPRHQGVQRDAAGRADTGVVQLSDPGGGAVSVTFPSFFHIYIYMYVCMYVC